MPLSVHSNRKPSYPAPLLLELGPVPRAAVSELGKGLELSQGTGGRPRGAFAPPPPAKPRWCRRERAAALAPVLLLLLLQTRAGTPASTRCTAPARPLAPAPKPGSEIGVGCHLRATARGLRCAAPRHPGRLPTGLGGSPAGAGRGARGLGVQSRRPRCGPTRPRGGAEPARGRLCDWLRPPPAPPAAAPEERGRGDPPPARSRPRARGIKGGRRAREPGPCSLRAPPAGRLPPPPTPLPARPSSGGTCSRAREPGSPRRRLETRQS